MALVMMKICVKYMILNAKTVNTVYLQFDMFPELEVVGVHVEVALEVGVVHEVGEVPGDGEVAVARHLLARVDAARVVQSRLTVARWRLAVMPQPTCKKHTDVYYHNNFDSRPWDSPNPKHIKHTLKANVQISSF